MLALISNTDLEFATLNKHFYILSRILKWRRAKKNCPSLSHPAALFITSCD